MAEQDLTDLTPLRVALIRCCRGYNADQAVRAMASALITILIGCTPDRAAALRAFERLAKAMLAHIEAAARPSNTSQHWEPGSPRKTPPGLPAGQRRRSSERTAGRGPWERSRAHPPRDEV
jgi:hypothetical protein